ncbi:MAG: hypothetical protein Q9226_009206, partial [Calogaya cf. arnoldii]
MTSNQADAEANRTAAAAIGFFRHLMVLCSALGESHIFTHAKHPNFLRGFESGSDDGGLFVGPGNIPGETSTDRTFALWHDYEGKPVVVPIDVKYSHPTYDSTGNVVWGFEVSSSQWDTAQAIILGSFVEPDYLAVIPMHYIHQRQQYQGAIRDRYPAICDRYRPLWTLHPLQPFPREMGPFILPSARLNQSIEGMHQFAKGECSEWVNQHTGVPFKTPALTRFSPSKLGPSQKTKQSAQAVVEKIHAAFQEYSTAYRVEFTDLFPFLGDFKIVDLLHGTETFVEAKLNACKWRLKEAGSSNYMGHNHLTFNEDGEERFVFSWKAQWDYLYTVWEGKALFIPRDLFPSTFWLDRTSARLYWPADGLDSLYDCALDLGSASTMVEKIERILHTSGKAQKQIPILPYDEEPIKKRTIDRP